MQESKNYWDTTFKLDKPFVLWATKIHQLVKWNYPLPEAQVDRSAKKPLLIIPKKKRNGVPSTVKILWK
jgi:MoxR-like ATPase